MRDVTERTDDAAVLMRVEAATHIEGRLLHTVAQLIFQTAAQALRANGCSIEPFLRGVCGLGKPQHVHRPGADRFDDDLRALALEEAEHPEVAIAFRGLRPEFAG